MRTVILGGTFNPIHYGHLYLAEAVRAEFRYDIVVFVPAYIPVHKQVDADVSPQQRLNMLRLATQTYQCFVVDDCEIQRGVPSYSIETIAEISVRYKLRENPGFIIGDDLVENFASWKKADQLSRRTDLIIAHRHDREIKQFTYPHRYVDNVLMPLSSSEIRENVEMGKSIRFLTPDPVVDYINEEKLYRRQQ